MPPLHGRAASWQWAPARESDEHDLLHTRATECSCGWTGADHRLCLEKTDAAHHNGDDRS